MQMNILEDSKVVFFVFMALGFLFPGAAEPLKVLLVPLLIIMMTLSVKDIHLAHLKKDDLGRAAKLVLINFFVLSPVYLLLSFLLVRNHDYRSGFILLAAVPPAAGIIPLGYIYHGDIRDSLIGEIVCYLFALVFSPILVYLFLGQSVNITFFIKILLLIIFLPVVIAHFMHGLRWKIFGKKNIMINMIYGISIYIFIGLNRETFLKDPLGMIPVTIVVLLATFGLGAVIYAILVRKKVKKKYDVMYVLFGTFKNGNSAATLGILFIGPAAAIPVAIRGLLTPFYFAFLEKLFHMHKESV